MAKLAAQMAEVERLEKEAERKEAEERAAHEAEAEAACLAAEKAARKAAKKGKKQVMEESGVNAEADGGAARSKQVKMVDAGTEEELESAEAPCKR